MNKRLMIAAKALFYFLLLGFALPPLIDRRASALWILGCVGISLVITVLPAYLIARLDRKSGNAHAVIPRAVVTRRKWLRIVLGALVMFLLMAFAWPAVIGEKVDGAWVIIAAIAAPAAVVIADYLTEKQKERKRRNDRDKNREDARE